MILFPKVFDFWEQAFAASGRGADSDSNQLRIPRAMRDGIVFAREFSRFVLHNEDTASAVGLPEF
jgi:hypothetical protein